MVNRQTQYGQDPNRIIDVGTYLSIGQSLKELERLINSFGRTLTDNERRLQQTLPGMISTFDRIGKEYASGNGKLSKSQAADLKVMIANKQNVLKWLNQLSKFDAKTGLSKNERGDQSFIQYASIFDDVLKKLTSSMERSYKQWDGYADSVNQVRRSYGLLPTARGASPQSVVTPTAIPQVPSAPIKSVLDDLEPLYKALERLGKLLSENKISENVARFRGYKVQTEMPKALAGAKNLGTTVQKTVGRYYGYPTQQPLYGAARYAGIKPPTKSQIRKYKFDKYSNKFGDSNLILANLHTALGGIPILGSITKLAASMSKGGGAMRDAGKGMIDLFGEKNLLGKIGKFLAGPIGIAIGATAIAVGAIYKQMKKSSPVLQAVSNLFELAWNLLWMPLGNALGTLLLPMAEWMIDFAIAFNRIFTDFSLEAIGDLLTSLWQLAWGGLLQIGSALPKAIVDGLLTSISDLFRSWGWDGLADIFDSIRNAYDTISDWIINFPTKWKEILSDGINAICNWFNGFLSGNFLSDLGTAIVDGIKGIVHSGGDAIKDTANSLLGWTGIKLATGGVITSPTIAMVGEAGPEAVIPLDKAGGIGTTYVINVNGDVYGVSDLEARIERVIQRTANKSYYR